MKDPIPLSGNEILGPDIVVTDVGDGELSVGGSPESGADAGGGDEEGPTIVVKTLKLGSGYAKIRRKLNWEVLFLALGIGVLLPYNASINVIPLVQQFLFPNKLWAFIANVSYTTALFAGFFLLLAVSSHVAVSHRFLFSYLFIGIPTVVLLGILVGSKNTDLFFVLGQLCLVFLGVWTAFANGTAVGLSYLFGPFYASALFLGQSCAGVVSFSLHFLFSNTIKSERLSIALLLGMASLWTFSCCMSYKLLSKSPPVQSLSLQGLSQNGLPQNKDKTAVAIGDGMQCNETSISKDRTTVQQPKWLKIVLGVARKRWNPLLCVFVLFTVTALLYPSVVSVLEPPQDKASTMWDTNIYVTVLLATFQIADVAGRLIVSLTLDLPLFWVWVGTLSRAICIPLLIVSQRLEDSTLFGHIAFRIIVILYLGITNGCFGSLSCIRVADTLCDIKDVEAGGQLTSFFVIAGYTVGAWSSLLTQVAN